MYTYGQNVPGQLDDQEAGFGDPPAVIWSQSTGVTCSGFV